MWSSMNEWKSIFCCSIRQAQMNGMEELTQIQKCDSYVEVNMYQT